MNTKKNILSFFKAVGEELTRLPSAVKNVFYAASALSLCVYGNGGLQPILNRIPLEQGVAVAAGLLFIYEKDIARLLKGGSEAILITSKRAAAGITQRAQTVYQNVKEQAHAKKTATNPKEYTL